MNLKDTASNVDRHKILSLVRAIEDQGHSVLVALDRADPYLYVWWDRTPGASCHSRLAPTTAKLDQIVKLWAEVAGCSPRHAARRIYRQLVEEISWRV